VVGVAELRHGQVDRHDLEVDPHHGEVLDLGPGQRADAEAAVALPEHEPLELEHPQRLAHRGAADAEPVGEAHLRRAFTG